MSLDPRRVNETPERQRADQYSDLDRRLQVLERGVVHDIQAAYVIDIPEIILPVGAPAHNGPSVTIAVPTTTNLVLVYVEVEVKKAGAVTGGMAMDLYEATDYSSGARLAAFNSSITTSYTVVATMPTNDLTGYPFTLPGWGGPRVFRATPGQRTYYVKTLRDGAAGTYYAQNGRLWVWAL